MTTMTRLSDLTGDYVLDTARTRIGFVARHAMATRVPGEFDEFEGSAQLDGHDPSRSRVELTIEARSIQTRNRRRDQQLRSKFLDADNYPTITFTSTGVVQVDRTNFKVTGDLTIRGLTRPVTVDFVLTGTEHDRSDHGRINFHGSVTINRKDWGVHWSVAGPLVSAKVLLAIDVAVVRRS